MVQSTLPMIPLVTGNIPNWMAENLAIPNLRLTDAQIACLNEAGNA
ncbi:MAG: hypothetical protein ACP5HS_09480 [Anaerolineae bacterium]